MAMTFKFKFKTLEQALRFHNALNQLHYLILIEPLNAVDIDEKIENIIRCACELVEIYDSRVIDD